MIASFIGGPLDGAVQKIDGADRELRIYIPRRVRYWSGAPARLMAANPSHRYVRGESCYLVGPNGVATYARFEYAGTS